VAGGALKPQSPPPDVPGRAFLVGGSVRDALLGQAAGDRDWVVVGSTPEAMLRAGFRPVGRDFPVFLHPRTGEEYALARTERKSAPGYHGFVVHASPEVTLEQDLARRDLTINAMAQDEEGRLIDPFGGQRDLAAGVLRHVSPAFAEDPVRLLRVARFAARWSGFGVAPETLALMAGLVQAGEVDALVAERVWQELARGLMEPRPSRMLQVLRECGAASRLLPGLVLDQTLFDRLDHAAQQGTPLPVRFACLASSVPALGPALRAPLEEQALASMLAREHAELGAPPRTPEAALALLERCDAWRRPERLLQLLQAAQCHALAHADWPPGQAWGRVVAAAQQVDTAAVARQAAEEGLAGPAVGERVRQARREAIARTIARAMPDAG
jgi:tRNA nucleotidyltransferase (CCA-adding enzyme)